MIRKILSVALCISIMLSCCAFSESQYEESDISGVEERTLKKGDKDTETDDSVLKLQQYLYKMGYLTDTPDGHFGGKTETALKELQEEFGLEVTGEADPYTMEQLESSIETTRNVQERLKAFDYLKGEADGIFGSATLQALIDFQTMHGLEPTGEMNEETQNLLFNGTNLIPMPTPAPTARVAGASGDDIKIAQVKLAEWGFLAGNPDGDYGNVTESAVKAFKLYQYERLQEYYKLNPTPSPTPAPVITPVPTPTLRPGEQPIIVDATIEPSPTPVPTPTPYAPSGEIDDSLLEYFYTQTFQIYRGDMALGDKNSDVLRLQRRLRALGYLYSGIDGDFGENTQRALKYFQYRNKLEISGVATERTQNILFSEGAVKSTEYVYKYKLVVDVSDQRTYAYAWTGTGYDELVKTFKCSTGKKDTPTPLGTWQSAGKAGGRWYYFKDFNCYAQYATRIFGGILFHSVLYGSRSESSLQRSSVSNLGRRASHGCIRLAVKDAKWIYDNCSTGTTVVIKN